MALSTNMPDVNAAAPEQLVALSNDTFQQVRALVYRESGIDLANHKRVMFASRLQKRLRDLGVTSFEDYYHLVTGASRDGELTVMLDCVSTNKTEFFREAHHFAFLRDQVLPNLARIKVVRIWSAACSSGEEPYSIAMTLADSIESPSTWDCRILASDISTRVLATAAAGMYPLAQVRPLGHDLVRRHFLRGTSKHSGIVKVKPYLADMIVFKRINLMEDRYPIKGLLDVIFCRNVMIYFDRSTQTQLVMRLAQCLKPGGYLFIGHAESLSRDAEELQYVAPTIYRRPK